MILDRPKLLIAPSGGHIDVGSPYTVYRHFLDQSQIILVCYVIIVASLDNASDPSFFSVGNKK